MSKGNRIPLRQFAVSEEGGCEFQFIFPRQLKSVPVLNADNKSLSLEFTGPPPAGGTFAVRQDKDAERMLFEFDVSKMMFHGEIIY